MLVFFLFNHSIYFRKTIFTCFLYGVINGNKILLLRRWWVGVDGRGRKKTEWFSAYYYNIILFSIGYLSHTLVIIKYRMHLRIILWVYNNGRALPCRDVTLLKQLRNVLRDAILRINPNYTNNILLRYMTSPA